MDSIWSPDANDWDKQAFRPDTFLRIKRDLAALISDPLPGIVVIPEPDDMTKVNALITGPFDTPYEGGFFYFLIRFPPDYPIRPPRVKMMTTCNNTVRFNPNIYRCGKICLSILGTWSGPAWSPALNLSSLLLSIQSLMSDKPFHNEPGFEKLTVQNNVGDVQRYNDIIQHETIRVAVCDNLEQRNTDTRHMPASLREMMEKSFKEFYNHYVEVCKKNLWKSGQPMTDPFNDKRGNFEYQSLLKRLEALKEKYIDEEVAHESGNSTDSSESELEVLNVLEDKLPRI